MFKGFTRLWRLGIKQLRKASKTRRGAFAKALPAAISLNAKPPAPPRRKTSKPKAGQLRSTRNGTATAKRGSSVANSPGKWLALVHDGLTGDAKSPARRLRYWLYLPSATSSGASLPLLVMLHGCDQSALAFAQGTRMNQLAEKHGFAVVYPEQSLRGHPHRCWPWYERALQAGGNEARLILGMLDKVQQRYPIDPTRTYAAGLSAGAAMAQILALNYPERFAAVGLHSGPVFGAGRGAMGAYAVMQHGLADARGALAGVFHDGGAGMPAMLIHGTADPVVRPINQAHLVQQFKRINWLEGIEPTRVTFKPAGRRKRHPAHAYRLEDYRVGRSIALRVCEIQHLAHAWSGGDCALPYNACGGPDASALLWAFLSRHRLKTKRLPAPAG